MVGGGWSGCCDGGINKFVYAGGAEQGLRDRDADETKDEDEGGEDVFDIYISAVVTQASGSPIFDLEASLVLGR